MTQMKDCMVSYFSANGNGEGVPRRYYCYLVVAGPGPMDGAGVATITTLAIHEGDRPCSSCRNCFFAPSGGPEAALALALHYLDAYHQGDRLRRVVSGSRAAVPSFQYQNPSSETPPVA
jgi:hypothetical protein